MVNWLGRKILLLPFGEKILMTLNIWFHEWHMNFLGWLNCCPEKLEPGIVADEKIFSDLSKESRDIVHDVVQIWGLCIPRELADGFFYNYKYFLPYESTYSDIVKRVKRIIKENRFPDDFGGSESLLFCHGLKNAPEKVKKYIENKDFIDAGVCWGDSIWAFSHFNPKKIHGFEPSPGNREKCRSLLQKAGIPDEIYDLSAMALGAEKEDLYFDGFGGGAKVVENGKLRIQCDTLDHICSANPDWEIGLIKADVEGMGLKLVRGAVEVIKKHRPVLSLSIYHNGNEFWGIYPLLKSLDLHYHFEIRCFGTVRPADVTLFAYPEELC